MFSGAIPGVEVADLAIAKERVAELGSVMLFSMLWLEASSSNEHIAVGSVLLVRVVLLALEMYLTWVSCVFWVLPSLLRWVG
jgi:hypothetical protein